MTFFAFHFEVHAEQGEARATMIEAGLFPVLFVMARYATLAQFFLVHIVLLVARHTVHTQLLLIQFAGMTRRAFDLFVLALQRIFRIFVMVEVNRLPVFFLVTGLTLRTEFAFVLVIGLVTSTAGERNFVA